MVKYPVGSKTILLTFHTGHQTAFRDTAFSLPAPAIKKNPTNNLTFLLDKVNCSTILCPRHEPWLRCQSHPQLSATYTSNRYISPRHLPKIRVPRSSGQRAQQEPLWVTTALSQRTRTRGQKCTLPLRAARDAPMAQQRLLYRANPRAAPVTAPVTKPRTKPRFFGTGKRAGGEEIPLHSVTRKLRAHADRSVRP